MPNCRWFHVTAPVPDAVLEACLERQQLYWPENELSVRTNLEATESVMKVDNASKTWRATQAWIFDEQFTLAVYDRDDHNMLVPIMLSEDWLSEDVFGG